MADFLTINTNIALSKAPEASLNAIADTAAEFVGAMTSGFNITIPNIEKIVNENLVGTGDEFPTQADNDYFNNSGITFTDRVNASQFAILLARFFSGTITDTPVPDTTAVDHFIVAQASSVDPQLKSSTVAAKIGGLDLILGGMVANSLQVGFSGGAQPTYSVEMIGTGKFAYMADQTPALVLPAPVAQDYMGSIAAIAISMNDGSSWDLSAAGRIQAFNIQASNKVIVGDRRPGDPFQTAGVIESGAYVPRLTRETRSVSCSATLYVDANKREWLNHLNNTTITSLVFKMVGKIADAVTEEDPKPRYEVEFTIPASIFQAVQVGDNGGKLVYNINILPLKAVGNTGTFKARVRNISATLS
jgi:hypothetical protein